MSKIDEGILALGRIAPPLSVRGIALRARTTGMHVEQVLASAGMLAGRPVFDEERVAPGVVLSREVAVLQVSADLAARGYRVYLPVNACPSAGKRIDLLAMNGQQPDVLRVVVSVGGIDGAGRLQRTKPLRDEGVVVAVAMTEGITYEPGLPSKG